MSSYTKIRWCGVCVYNSFATRPDGDGLASDVFHAFRRERFREFVYIPPEQWVNADHK